MAAALLSPQEAVAYWDERHRTQDDLRSGGHVGLDYAANEIFYLSRLGKLVDIIGDLTSTDEPLYVLDAGCGKGYFARALARCGFRVDGFDVSQHAIAECRRRSPTMRFEVSSLDAYRSPYLYDVVLAVDVLFHVLDDAEWEASLRNLASLTRLGGRLVVSDESNDERRELGDYIVHRARDDYLSALNRLGFRLDSWRPYDFRDNRVGFFDFIRTR